MSSRHLCWLRRSSCLSGIGAVFLCLQAGSAHANPLDGVVSAGNATIQQSGNLTSIHQGSDRAVIDWRGFDIAPDEIARFDQPSANSITLNRVSGATASKIDGTLSANGKIVIVNPNGVVFGSGAKVDVGGLTATSADIRNDDFMQGKMEFTTPGQATARVINNGTITAREAGLVSLVAPHVENNGVIQAKLGKVQLASGDVMTMDMAGDGLLQVAVKSDQLQAQQVKNTGVISADGGQVLLTAAAAREVVDSLIVNTGVIEAKSQGAQTGSITLYGEGIKTTVRNEGRMDASGKQAGERGGKIVVTGHDVVLAAHSSIEASGHSGGGDIKIGGDYLGSGTTPRATTVKMEKQATIAADAIMQGDGGRVILWSDDTTRVEGAISARGGAQHGNGGFVETSGKARLQFDGMVDTRAPNGDAGTWLLDPYNITIQTAASNTNIDTATPPNWDAIGDASIISVNLLQTQLGLGNVVIRTGTVGGSGLGNITVANSVAWNTANSLTLEAANDIIVNGSINNTGGSGNIILRAGLDGSGVIDVNNQITAGGSLLLDANGGSITSAANLVAGNGVTLNQNLTMDGSTSMINGGLGGISLQGVSSGSRNLTLVADQDINWAGSLTGTSGTLTVYGFSNGTSIGLGGEAGTIQLTTAEMNNTSGFSTVNIGSTAQTGALNVGARSWGNVYLSYLTGSGIITINGANSSTQNINLTTGSDVAINAQLTAQNVGIMRATAGTSIGLAGETGNVMLDSTELGYLNASSSVSFGYFSGSASGALNVGAQSWNKNVYLYSGSGTISVNGAQTFTGGKNLTISTNGNIDLNADVTGSGGIPQFMTDVAGGILGASGAFNLTASDLDHMKGSWAYLLMGSSNSSLTVGGGYTWNYAPRMSSSNGNVIINGTQTFTTGAPQFTTSNGDFVLNGNFVGGSGSPFFYVYGGTPSFGSTSGVFNITAADLANMGTQWTSLIFQFGSVPVVMNGALTWPVSLDLRSYSSLTVSADQNFGTRNLTLDAPAAPVTLSADVLGTGVFQWTANNMGLGTTNGTASMTSGSLSRLKNWSVLNFINNVGQLILGTNTWNSSLNLRSNNGAIRIDGAQELGNHDLTLQIYNTSPLINADVNGTGTVTFRADSNSIGLAGSSGTMQITAADLNRFGDNWSQMVFGWASHSNAINVGSYDWKNPVSFISSSGVISFLGDQQFNANNVTIQTTTNPVISAFMRGTGDLKVFGNTSIGLAGGGGTLNLSAAELNFIADGWRNLIFGDATMSSAMTINQYDWRDPVSFISRSNITLGGNQTVDGNMTFQTDADVALAFTVGGNGRLKFSTVTPGNSMNLVGAGTFSLGTTELNNIVDGWDLIEFGSEAMTGNIVAGAYSNWRDPVSFVTNTGVISFAAQNFAANDVTVTTNSAPTITGDLTGTGIFTFKTTNPATNIGLAGASGTLQFTAAMLNRLLNGWSELHFGNGGTGALNIGAYAWRDPVVFHRAASGTISVDGAQTAASGSNASITFDGATSITQLVDLSAASGGGDITLNDFSHTLAANLLSGGGNILINGLLSLSADSTINAGAGSATIANGAAIAVGAHELTLVANGSFINDAGVGAITTSGAGRWSIYTTNPTDTLGEEDLDTDFRRYSCTYGGTCPSWSASDGNGLFYSYTPRLTVTATDSPVVYGDAAPSSYAYVVTGYLDTDDENNDSVTGGGIFSSDYVQGNNAGTGYTISDNGSDLVSGLGYAYDYDTTAGTVGKRALSVVIHNQTLAHDAVLSPLDGTDVAQMSWSNFYSTENTNNIASLTYDYDGAATGTTNAPGHYQLSISGFSDANYTLDLVNDMTSGTLTVSNAPPPPPPPAGGGNNGGNAGGAGGLTNLPPTLLRTAAMPTVLMDKSFSVQLVAEAPLLQSEDDSEMSDYSQTSCNVRWGLSANGTTPSGVMAPGSTASAGCE